MNKKILFLSALDFKNKSIQVIRKTPEAYVKKGWDVCYIVARDCSKEGNYSYEDVINPDGVNILRTNYPFTYFLNRCPFSFFKKVFLKIASCIVVLKLAYYGMKALKKIDFDVLYGYEIQGVLAGQLLRLLYIKKHLPFVTRFQGTVITDIIDKRKYLKLFLYVDHLVALFLPSHLCIMTDDGTRGEKLLKKIRSFNCRNLKFWINGVDDFAFENAELQAFQSHYSKMKGHFVLLSVSRLESWKRVDRIIQIVDILVHGCHIDNFILYAVGGGREYENLSRMISAYNLGKYVVLTGPIENEKIKYFYHCADFFISTNDLSNVGNPLLEAIRTNKVIFTLNTGDTCNWIKHGFNGFIYDIQENYLERIAKDIIICMSDPAIRKKVKINVQKTVKEKLWTWDERMNAELREVDKLFIDL